MRYENHKSGKPNKIMHIRWKNIAFLKSSPNKRKFVLGKTRIKLP